MKIRIECQHCSATTTTMAKTIELVSETTAYNKSHDGFSSECVRSCSEKENSALPFAKLLKT